MFKRKILSIILASTLLIGNITGCGNAKPAENSGVTTDVSSGNSDDTMKIVATIFPEYDWVNTILGEKAENADLTLLLDSGVDMHSYQPTAEDIAKVKRCDMFIYVGGESDKWVEDVIGSADNDDMVVINLLDVLGDSVKTEEIVEGMEHNEYEHDEEHEEEKDEHVWLSLNNASILCEEIAVQLGNVDEANKDLYMSNYEAYKEKLMDLDSQYKEVVNGGSKKTLLFGDRFPFRYLVDDYGLDYYAAFAGCSAESEASFETIVFLAEKVDELDLPAIMTIEGPDHKLAESVKESTKSKDQKILTLDSMQSTTSKDIAGGTTYLSVMTNNLEVLKEALQ